MEFQYVILFPHDHAKLPNSHSTPVEDTEVTKRDIVNICWNMKR